VGDITRRDFIKLAMTTGAAAGASLSGMGEIAKAWAASARWPIDHDVATTLQKTIAFDRKISGLGRHELPRISQYQRHGYGLWTPGPGLPAEPRTDIMPAGYAPAGVAARAKLLNFFAFTDIHITDKECPSQLIYLQQMHYPTPLRGLEKLGPYPWAFMTSCYSPVMLYTTHVLDAAVQTVNALHRQRPFDFGISLGDTCNSTLYNETRWYIDVLDGKFITPSSGAHLGADKIDYQRPYQAAGLDKSIPWYQTLGNHDHFYIGSLPMTDFLRQSLVSDTVLALGDVMLSRANITNPPLYYMGALDGSTPNGDIIGAGPVAAFERAPKVAADPNRRSLARTEWIDEFFQTTSEPVGHGFHLVDPGQEKGFACYSFAPKAKLPLKVIVLDDTQIETDGSTDIHGHGFLDAPRWTWLKKELAAGDAAGQLMIIAAHIPIGVDLGQLAWWNDPQNAVTLKDLIAELHRHPNLLLWIAGHRHVNIVKAFVTNDATHPENGFWHVETSALRDWPQQFRTFEIALNSDYTISIVTVEVDPAVKEGTPAAKSRQVAIAAYQITANNLSPNVLGADPTISPTVPDPTVKSMLPSCSYNATLFKQLSPQMIQKLKTLYPPT
jgi:metallophosphoesterase (TIGR03768 family)